VPAIAKRWNQPDFGLRQLYPWIASVREALDRGEALEMERQLLRATWNRWVQLSDEFYFSFETILLYLARWEIVDRWTRLDEQLGRQKFDQLLSQTLATDGVAR